MGTTLSSKLFVILKSNLPTTLLAQRVLSHFFFFLGTLLSIYILRFFILSSFVHTSRIWTHCTYVSFLLFLTSTLRFFWAKQMIDSAVGLSNIMSATDLHLLPGRLVHFSSSEAVVSFFLFYLSPSRVDIFFKFFMIYSSLLPANTLTTNFVPFIRSTQKHSPDLSPPPSLTILF